jgi:hypothetical protein
MKLNYLRILALGRRGKSEQECLTGERIESQPPLPFIGTWMPLADKSTPPGGKLLSEVNRDSQLQLAWLRGGQVEEGGHRSLERMACQEHGNSPRATGGLRFGTLARGRPCAAESTVVQYVHRDMGIWKSI